MVLLDWEKAFDRIDQKALFEAMERMGIDDKLIRLTSQLYKDPTFKVEMDGESYYRFNGYEDPVKDYELVLDCEIISAGSELKCVGDNGERYTFDRE